MSLPKEEWPVPEDIRVKTRINAEGEVVVELPLASLLNMIEESAARGMQRGGMIVVEELRRQQADLRKEQRRATGRLRESRIREMEDEQPEKQGSPFLGGETDD